jgi:hypothetical protein
MLVDHPADATGPRSINAYLVEVQDFTAAARLDADEKGTHLCATRTDDKNFKIDPQRLLYSLQCKHNAWRPNITQRLAANVLHAARSPEYRLKSPDTVVGSSSTGAATMRSLSQTHSSWPATEDCRQRQTRTSPVGRTWITRSGS